MCWHGCVFCVIVKLNWEIRTDRNAAETLMTSICSRTLSLKEVVIKYLKGVMPSFLCFSWPCMSLPQGNKTMYGSKNNQKIANHHLRLCIKETDLLLLIRIKQKRSKTDIKDLLDSRNHINIWPQDCIHTQASPSRYSANESYNWSDTLLTWICIKFNQSPHRYADFKTCAHSRSLSMILVLLPSPGLSVWAENILHTAEALRSLS